MKGRTNVGGGKPEEEKTVTAGTSVIEVNPSSGKVMKKVTVNPTPTESKEVTAGTSDTTVSPTEGKHLSGVTVHPTSSQEKTVIPTADGFKVIPETGKLLSAVFVDGDSDLVAENIKQGVNIFGVDGTFDNSHGAYVWKKLTAEGGDFVDFVVSDQETAYPDGGTQDGYWYEKVVEGIPSPAGFTKVTVDTFTPTSNQRLDTTTIEHSHGSIPTLCVVIGNPLTTSDVPLQVGAINGSKKYGIMLGEGTGYWRAGAVLTANNFRFSESYGFNFIAGVEYTVICMS